MRFTRPGARPCHATGRLTLGFTKLRGLVLCAGIDDEGSGAELRSRQVLELVARAVGRVELDMEVMVAAGAARRCLVHRHHVRQRAFEKPVVLLQQPLQDSGEGLVVVAVEIEQSATVSARTQKHLIWPSREGRYERDPVLIAQDCPFTLELTLEHVAIQATAVFAYIPRLGPQLSLEDRREERVRIDLSVWVTQRHADRLATVFEYVDVAHVGEAAQLIGAVAPHLDQVANVFDALLPERRVVIRRVADHLAPSLLSGEGWEPILEYRDVVVGLGDLGFGVARPGGTERTVVLGRVVRAVLAPRRDGDPLFEQRMPTKLTCGIRRSAPCARPAERMPAKLAHGFS